MRIYQIVIVTSIFFSLTYGLIGMRLLGPIGLKGGPSITAWLILALLPIFHVFTFVLHMSHIRGTWNVVLQWFNFTLLGMFSLVFALVVIRDILWLILRLSNWIITHISSATMLPAAHSARMQLLNYSAVGILLIAGLMVILGLIEARKLPRIVNVDIPIKNLHPDLEDFRILQLTDIHVGPTIRRNRVKAITDLANDQKADLVVLTGDLVDGSVRELKEHTEPFGGLAAPHGKYFVTGNHEYYSGPVHWIKEIQRLGFTVLDNDHELIMHKGARLLLAGVPDLNGEAMTKNEGSDPVKAMQGAPEHDVSILLAHQPRSLFDAKDVGYDLQISGHTHGGQFIPWNLVIPIQQPITSGLEAVQGKSKRMWVYVSHGAGYWGPPLRFGIPTEISVLRLTREN